MIFGHVVAKAENIDGKKHEISLQELLKYRSIISP